MFFWGLFFSSGLWDLLAWLILHSQCSFEGSSEEFVQGVASHPPVGAVALNDFLPFVCLRAAILK